MPDTYLKGNEVATIDVALVTIEDADNNVYGLKTSNKVQVNPVTETNDAIKLIVKGVLIAQKPSKTTITGNTIVLTDNVLNAQLAMILQGGTVAYSKKYSSTPGAISAGVNYIAVTNDNNETEYLSFNVASALTATAVEYNDASGVLELVKGSSRTRKSYTVTSTAPSGGTSIAVTAAADTSRIKSYSPPVAGSSEQIEPFKLCCYSAIYNAAGLIVGYEKITYPNCHGTPVSFSSEDDVFRVPEYTINSAPDSDQAPYVIDYVPRLPVEAESV